MTTTDDFYAQRIAATMGHLSGGRITAEDVAARMAPPPTERLSASEIMALIPPLSGSHHVSVTMRGRGWGPAKERERIDWGSTPEAWPRGPDGRFIVVRHEDDDDDLDG
jgi:hypothetical protein